MRIFDTHNHLWEYNEKYFSWISAEMDVIKRDFSIAELHKLSTANNVHYNVLVQAIPEMWETEKLLEIANQSNRVAGVTGWVDVAKGEAIVPDLMRLIEVSNKLCGIRYMSQGLAPEHMLEDKFIEGVRSVGRLGLMYELLVSDSQLEQVARLIDVCSDVFFIINHIAKPDIQQGKIKTWQVSMEKIADFKNVYCKLSGMVTEANLSTWHPSDIYPYIDVIMKCFGDARVMYGSDYPVCLLAATYKQVLDLVVTWFDNNPQFSLENILFNNAQSIYLNRQY